MLDPASGWAWGLSIVLLTVFVRLLLFPLFVKQIKSQRRMQELAPKIKELQKVHKGDRETLNTEMMKLYKDNNANPISGCLPLILQLPGLLRAVQRHPRVQAPVQRPARAAALRAVGGGPGRGRPGEHLRRARLGGAQQHRATSSTSSAASPAPCASSP